MQAKSLVSIEPEQKPAPMFPILHQAPGLNLKTVNPPNEADLDLEMIIS